MWFILSCVMHDVCMKCCAAVWCVMCMCVLYVLFAHGAWYLLCDAVCVRICDAMYVPYSCTMKVVCLVLCGVYCASKAWRMLWRIVMCAMWCNVSYVKCGRAAWFMLWCVEWVVDVVRSYMLVVIVHDAWYDICCVMYAGGLSGPAEVVPTGFVFVQMTARDCIFMHGAWYLPYHVM